MSGFIGAGVHTWRGGIDRDTGCGQVRCHLFEQKDRSIALGIGDTAPNIGALITPLAIPALAVAFGWQAAFLVSGALGLVWVAAWLTVKLPPPLPDGEGSTRIGAFATLWAKRLGATVIGTLGSDTEAAVAISHGLDPVIFGRDADFAAEVPIMQSASPP